MEAAIIVVYVLAGMGCAYWFLGGQRHVYVESLLVALFVMIGWPVYLIGLCIMRHFNGYWE